MFTVVTFKEKIHMHFAIDISPYQASLEYNFPQNPTGITTYLGTVLYRPIRALLLFRLPGKYTGESRLSSCP